jgi:hypothetical protein
MLMTIIILLMTISNARAYHSSTEPHYAFYVGTIPDIGDNRKFIMGRVMGLGLCLLHVKEIHRFYDKTTASYAAFRCIEIKRD